jgi:pyruvate/2-oxoglutarate dehydrogenase complex dihydrolipoamide acyltransferase (E2) component
MAIEIVLPQIGASSQPGKIVRWFSHEGGQVTEGQPLYVVEVAGAAHEVEAPATGTLRINAGLDRTYEAGSILGVIEYLK